MSAPILPECGAASLDRSIAYRARIAVGIAVAVCSMSPRALRRFLTWITRRSRRPTAADILRYRQAVVAVSSLCAGDGCLPRSVATAVLARSYGHAPSWCTGIRQDPFVAHAWVELDGVPIGEADDVKNFQRTLMVTPRYAEPGPGMNDVGERR